MNSYELSRSFFDFSFENPEVVKPNHVAMYFFAIEHCNRLGWKDKFGFPTTMVMEAIGIKSYNTYINTLNDLVKFGFINLVEKSSNQYSANIIALSKNDTSNNKALDKALIKHGTKQSESTSESIDSIDKQYNKLTKKQINNILEFYNSLPTDILSERIKELIPVEETDKIDFAIFWDMYGKKKGNKDNVKKIWDRLSYETQDKIITTLPDFKKTVTDIQYLPFPQTYLNEKRWNDELETQTLFNSSHAITPTKPKPHWAEIEAMVEAQNQNLTNQ